MVPRYCIENMEYLNIQYGDTVYQKMAVLQKCFCDIPLHRLMDTFELRGYGEAFESLSDEEKLDLAKNNTHPDFYGKYAIAFSKEWGENKHLQPIQYINEKSDYAVKFSKYISNALNAEELPENCSDDILYRLSFVKSLRGIMSRKISRKGEKKQIQIYIWKNFHDEKEWRFVPDNEVLNVMNLGRIIANPSTLELDGAIDIIKKLIAALGLINSMFKLDNNKLEDGSYAVVEIKKYFEMQYKLFKKMNEIQEFFGILFDTSKISELRNSDIQDIEELYALIIEKKAVRLNSKLTSTETTGIKFKQNAEIPEVGANIDIVFNKTVTYSICGQNITIYTANILLNAVVKEILTYDNGETKVLYGDEDRKPMYISYTGFKTRDEAEQESKTLMKNKQKYVEAFQKTN